jgi:hypothetical protein
MTDATPMGTTPSSATGAAATPEAFLHLSSGTVRFWVRVNEQFVGASIRREILHYRYHATRTNDDPMVTYAENLAELHAAVRLRVTKGSIEPVMLRDADIQRNSP